MPRRTAAALAAVVLSTGLVAAPQVSASAAGDSCISKKEYRKVKQGMTRPQVKQVTGTNGKSLGRAEASQDYIIEKRRYRVCTSRKGAAELGFVSVMGGPYKLTRKTVDWR
ncbi:hypothetical protein [Nocardioides dongkuii]|uniref:hypothetical protein n=1 Tax=Nocardioides dongkuii TaxID=2760089 RepID=UPI0015FBB259|nr:hypothetical protein [Nocardioides dongkuii]